MKWQPIEKYVALVQKTGVTPSHFTHEEKTHYMRVTEYHPSRRGE